MWLILGRTKDEDIIITTKSGEQITVRVVDIRGDKVRLGFAADKSIEVHRQEVYEAIARERSRASGRPAISGDIPAAEAVCDPPVEDDGSAGEQGPQYLGSDEVGS